MNLQDLKEFLLKEPHIKELNLQCNNPTYTNYNKKLFKIICTSCNYFIKTGQELLYLLDNVNKLKTLHIFCKICKKKNNFINPRRGYHHYCSVKCKSLDEDLKEKYRQKMILLTGEDNYSKSKQFKKLWVDKDWVGNIVKNRRQKCLQKYGQDSFSKTEQFKKLYDDKEFVKNIQIQIQNKVKELYGENNYAKTKMFKDIWKDEDKVEQIVLKRSKKKFKLYGDENYNNRELALNTTQMRYGEKHYAQTQKSKDRYKNTEFVSKMMQKQYETKKKNNSFHISEPEDLIYQFLVYIFNFEDIIPQYKDNKRYPFMCDFYIKSLDLFIEINFDPSHGKEPFNSKNFEHLEKLKEWKKKAEEIAWNGNKKNRYLGFINVWTIYDPIKFQTAKENNLNYLAFYNWDQFYNWYITLTPDL